MTPATTTAWPSLPLEAWLPTRETLHRYTQIIGKIQLALTPMVNHFWNVALRVTARGLATSALRHDGRTFDIELDLVEHRLIARTDDGASHARDLRPVAVAEFYRDVLAMLGALGVRIAIWDHPVEIRTHPIPFSRDMTAGPGLPPVHRAPPGCDRRATSALPPRAASAPSPAAGRGESPSAGRRASR